MNVPKLRFKEFTDKWEEKRLGEIGEVITGKTPSTKDEKNWNGEIQFVTPTDMKGKKYQLTTERTVSEELNIKILPKGTVMFTCIGATIGKMSISTKNCITNQQINSVLLNKNINNEYIYYFLLKEVPKIQASKSTTTMPIINKTEFSKLIVELPCFEEQQKIADFLSSIDNKISIIEEKLNLFNEYKKGIMKKIFNQKLRFKDNNGNDYPSWNLVTTKEISKITMGFTPNTKDESMWNGEYKWLSIADLKENGKYIYKTGKTITAKGVKNKKILEKGTLVMSFKLTLGRLGIISEEMFTNEAICHFNWFNKELINTEYIYYYLNSIDISSFGKQAIKGITLNTESLNSIEIELPCLEEQQKIADFLSSIDNKIEKISDELENLKEFKKGLLQKMFI